jgi:hypothetical protein
MQEQQRLQALHRERELLEQAMLEGPSEATGVANRTNSALVAPNISR